MTTVVNDLSKGVVPIALLISGIIGALAAGMWFQANQSQVDGLARDMTAFQQTTQTQLTDMRSSIQVMSNQIAAVNLTMAQGPKLPDNVVYRADLLKFCVENRQLKCPEF